MTELGKMIVEENIQKGLEEGLKQGKKQMLIKMCIKLLTRKFGPLSKDVQNKIENSSNTILEIIVEDILDFEKLEDVFKYLR